MNEENKNEQIPIDVDFVPRKKIYKRWWFWAIIAFLAIAVISSVGSTNSVSDLVDMPEQEYRDACKQYSYDEIARYPDKYEKKLAKFTGQVIQAIYDGNEIQMRVNVTEDNYGFYDDTVFVFYTVTNGVNVLEGDIIDMYGELRGIQKYESVLGAEISIPRIYVKYIDIIGK